MTTAPMEPLPLDPDSPVDPVAPGEQPEELPGADPSTPEPQPDPEPDVIPDTAH